PTRWLVDTEQKVVLQRACSTHIQRVSISTPDRGGYRLCRELYALAFSAPGLGLAARQDGDEDFESQGPLHVLLQQALNDTRRETIPRHRAGDGHGRRRP